MRRRPQLPMMTNRDPENDGGERPSAAQQESARSLLETVIETANPGGTVPFRSTGYGPSGGELGFSYRNDSLMVEYQTVANAADSVPDVTAASSELIELNDHAPLPAAGEPYGAVESSALELVADTVIGTAAGEALEPVTIWPVANDPGLYRVGYENQEKEFLYAVAFKIPLEAMQ